MRRKPRGARQGRTACCRRFARCLAIFWREIGKPARTCGTSPRREYGSSASGRPPYAGCRGAASTSPLMTRARAERDREIGLWRAALPSMQCPRRASEIRSGFGTWVVSLLPRERTFALAGSFHLARASAHAGRRVARQSGRCRPWLDPRRGAAEDEMAIGSRQPATRTARNSYHPVRQVLRVSRRLPPYRRQGRECGRPCGRWKNGGRSGLPFCLHSVP
jgi:hypothetical protein